MIVPLEQIRPTFKELYMTFKAYLIQLSAHAAQHRKGWTGGLAANGANCRNRATNDSADRANYVTLVGAQRVMLGLSAVTII